MYLLLVPFGYQHISFQSQHRYAVLIQQFGSKVSDASIWVRLGFPFGSRFYFHYQDIPWPGRSQKLDFSPAQACYLGWRRIFFTPQLYTNGNQISPGGR